MEDVRRRLSHVEAELADLIAEQAESKTELRHTTETLRALLREVGGIGEGRKAGESLRDRLHLLGNDVAAIALTLQRREAERLERRAAWTARAVKVTIAASLLAALGTAVSILTAFHVIT